MINKNNSIINKLIKKMYVTNKRLQENPLILNYKTEICSSISSISSIPSIFGFSSIPSVRYFSNTCICKVDLNELKRVKEANEASLMESDRNKLDNRSELNQVNHDILAIQMNHIPNLPDVELARVANFITSKESEKQDKIDEIESMDPDNIRTEVRESSKEFALTSHNTELTRGLDAMISPIVGDMGAHYNQLQVTRDEIQRQGEFLHANHIDLVNREIDLSEQIKNKENDKDQVANNPQPNQTAGEYIDSLPTDYNPLDDNGLD